MIGKTIDHYLILEKLGNSETTTVYKAQDLRLDRVVVLKAIDVPENDSDALAAFQKEARAGVSLSHPNIASIFDIIDQPALKRVAVVVTNGTLIRTWRFTRSRLTERDLND